MFGNLFRRRSFSHILKDAQRDMFDQQGGLFTAAANMDVAERQRAAAFKAWETRRRNAKDKNAGGGKNAGGRAVIGARMRRQDEEVAEIAKNVIPKMGYSKFKGMGAEVGINQSGIITTPQGRNMFLKVAGESGEREIASWQVAKAIGWDDVALPMHRTSFNGERAIVRDLMPQGVVWRRAPNDLRHKAMDDTERLRKVALFEYVIQARDRHDGNYWVDRTGKLWPIDLGFAFSDSIRPQPSDVYTARQLLNRVPKAWVKQVLDARNDILLVTKDTPGHDGPRALFGIEQRLAHMEKAYNAAGKGEYVDIALQPLQ